MTCSLKPERRGEAYRGAAPSLRGCLDCGCSSHRAPAQYPEDEQVVALQGGTKEAALGGKERDKGRLLSKPLVVVNHIDAGVLCLDLSSQLRLQPGHMYGAAIEQRRLDECALDSASQTQGPASLYSQGKKALLLSERLAHCHSPSSQVSSAYQASPEHTEGLRCGVLCRDSGPVQEASLTFSEGTEHSTEVWQTPG